MSIEIRHLSKTFANGFKAVSAISVAWLLCGPPYSVGIPSAASVACIAFKSFPATVTWSIVRSAAGIRKGSSTSKAVLTNRV